LESLEILEKIKDPLGEMAIPGDPGHETTLRIMAQ
jgi:hypothetical protein